MLGIREVIVVASRTPQGTLAGYQWNRRPRQSQREGLEEYGLSRVYRRAEFMQRMCAGCWLRFGRNGHLDVRRGSPRTETGVSLIRECPPYRGGSGLAHPDVETQGGAAQAGAGQTWTHDACARQPKDPLSGNTPESWLFVYTYIHTYIHTFSRPLWL